ncbi:MAG: hypothetical protein N4A74_21330 [Carboxylicivirga sp.]|jgi:hypothetical protein|nr:hypothetical protein [Carboxylicivirga sp.]
MKQLLMAVLVLAFISACNQQKKQDGWTVEGSLEGVTDGIIQLKKGMNDQNPKEFQMTDGKFTITGPSVSEPTNILLEVKGKDLRFGLYVENGEATYSGSVVEKEMKGWGERPPQKYLTIEGELIVGSIANQHQKEYREAESAARGPMPNFREMTEDEVTKYTEEREQKMKNVQVDFIKKHPNAFYSGIIASRLTHGMDSKGIEEVLAMLDPSLSTSHVRALKEKVANSKDVDIAEVITASDVSYKVENAYNGSAFLDVIYLGMLSNDQVCALCKDGTVKIIDAKGQQLNQFKPEFEVAPTTMAVDKTDNIYVLLPLQKETTRKFRGKTMKAMETVGYKCEVYNVKGEKQHTLELDGLKTATGARVADNKLMVADFQNRIIGVFNIETGKQEAALQDMRPCCMILDFSVNDKNEVLVANLGAFRVQAYNLKGEQLLAFGKRGKGVSDFHGCCNPVSVAYLSNGAIVTVEKDPTRVKIYSKDGAKQIEGIEELVKGCSYIPMIVDSKDNLYLASPSKGMVKCVAI